MDVVPGMGENGVVVPPVLYLPCEAGADEEAARIQLRRLEDGRVALFAYTALDRLGRCCGPRQPWVLYKTETLDALAAEHPFDLVVFDHEVPEELWYGGAA